MTSLMVLHLYSALFSLKGSSAIKCESNGQGARPEETERDFVRDKNLRGLFRIVLHVYCCSF